MLPQAGSGAAEFHRAANTTILTAPFSIRIKEATMGAEVRWQSRIRKSVP